MKIHTIVILAGGDGDRFYPLEEKMRFRFNGLTVLQHIVTAISPYAENIVVVTNSHNAESVQMDLSQFSVTFCLQTKDAGGMADAVLAAKENISGDILVLNANDIFDFTLIPRLVETTQKEKSPIGFVAKHLKEYFPGAYVIYKEEKAVGIIEKPDPNKTPSDYVKFVCDYIPQSASFIATLRNLESTDDQYERAISILMEKDPATCIKYEGDWTTLKYSWHILSMQEYFFTHHLKKAIDTSASIHKTAVIEGGVFVGKNVKIGAFCKIMGPCYIADNVIIGDHSLIRSSTIGHNTLIGSGCEVARSYLAEEVMLHRNYVGDSVLSSGTSMGAGAVTANYRFDAVPVKTPVKNILIDTKMGKLGLIAGKKVKIGVNVSTYPGVKLAPGTKILPGEVVTKDR